MTEVVTAPTRAETDAPLLARLSPVDRFLPVWILAAMGLGLGLGRAVPTAKTVLDSAHVTSGVSLPIFVGLLVMIYPVLAKVRYGQLDRVAADRRLLVSSLVLNWIVGPALMFALAWAMLPDQPAYRTGLIIVGLARCIAMVLIWNDLACGDRESAAVLVALNSVFQVVAYAGLGYFYLHVLPGWLHLDQTTLHVSALKIATSVLIFLGVPLVAGLLTRILGERARGRVWYETKFLPRLGPFALYGLLFTIVVLFALQGDTITHRPADVARIALPLLAYFALMWGGSFALGRSIGLPYERTVTLAFTAAGNNFELGIAVAIGVFGVTSGQALAGVVGPLIEVPVLVGLVYVALAARRHYGATTAPVVLFACIHNSGRSVAARVLAERYGQGRVTAISAGSQPANAINPVVAQVLAERGLSTDDETPTLLDSALVAGVAVVVTMGCGETCPVAPGKRYEDWAVDDPKGQDIATVRRIVDDIDARVKVLIAGLVKY